MAPAPDRATVIDPGKPETPLPETGTFEATPAFRAIQDGLGAYLASQGYVAEHPLLYVNETEAPYVYVRFEISTDGLGFIDTTFIYSPGVADQLNEIFEAYEVYAKDEPRTPYTSETMMLGRPVHASIQALETYVWETSIDWVERYRVVVSNRPKRKPAQRRRIVRAAKRRAKLRGSHAFPKFGRRPAMYELLEDEPSLIGSLPVNWNLDLSVYRPNWSVEIGEALAANASVEKWLEFVEPRLIHGSRERGTDTSIKTCQSPASYSRGGYGLLGIEWQFLDRLYWSMKVQFGTPYFWEDNKIQAKIEDAAPNLATEFEHLQHRVHSKARNFFRSQEITAENLSETERQDVISRAVADEDVQISLRLYARQSAILANRLGVTASPTWKTSERLKIFNLGEPAEEMLENTLEFYL